MKVDPMQLFWVFFMLSAVQPVLRQRLLEATRKRLIARIERQRGSRVVLLVHRQESMSFLGFPVIRYIDVDDSEFDAPLPPAGPPPALRRVPAVFLSPRPPHSPHGNQSPQLAERGTEL